MGTWSKIIPSGSTDGQGVVVTGTAPSSGNTFHTAVTGAAQSLDEISMYAYNSATSRRIISVQIGPTTATGSQFSQLLETGPTGYPMGLQPVLPGLVLRNSKTVKVFATAASVITVFGWVNRYAS